MVYPVGGEPNHSSPPHRESLRGVGPWGNLATTRDIGRRLWERNLPAAPIRNSGLVLDGDKVLLPLADGSIHGLTPSGDFVRPVHDEPGVRGIVAAGGRYLLLTDEEVVCCEGEGAGG